MKILAIEKEAPETTDEQFAPFLRQEAYRVWELYKSGVIRETYFRRDREESVLILECQDTQEASRVLQSLPLVSNGLISFDVIPLAPYPGFERLFGLTR
ncbi:MAG TPA: muconolactone Delta-isomerase family protein [Bacteroidota bacterium]|nr:muconolactone Delta-isomerase family protein [Bacteroidota bacterium]